MLRQRGRGQHRNDFCGRVVVVKLVLSRYGYKYIMFLQIFTAVRRQLTRGEYMYVLTSVLSCSSKSCLLLEQANKHKLINDNNDMTATLFIFPLKICVLV